MTSGPNWREVLEAFRRAEHQTTAFAVMEGEVMARMLSVWPDVEARVERPPDLGDLRTPETTSRGQWQWLWRARFPDGPPWALWAQLAGVALDYRRETMERFVNLRVVYPDGSLHAVVRAWLAHQLVGDIRGRRRASHAERR